MLFLACQSFQTMHTQQKVVVFTTALNWLHTVYIQPFHASRTNIIQTVLVVCALHSSYFGGSQIYNLKLAMQFPTKLTLWKRNGLIIVYNDRFCN